MKRFLTGLVVLVALLGIVSFVPQVANAQNTGNFNISEFTADYYLGRTEEKVPTMQVEELIMAEFPNYNQNHGILRAIPTSYKGQPLDIQIKSITNGEGEAYPYSISKQNGNLVLKIGDPNTYVKGQTVYNIVYTLKNQISFWPDYDEFYWNVNGTQWEQPFGQVTARVHVPASLASSLQERELCYAGVQGSTIQNCSINRQTEDGSTIVTISADDLSPTETLTFVLAF